MMQEKVVLITGAARGIGRATADAFAQEGAHLALLDHDADGLQMQATRLREQGIQVSTSVVNLASLHGVSVGTQEALAPFAGRVDVVVSNVGMLLAAPFEQITFPQWLEVFTLNVFSHVLLVKAVLPQMQTHGGCILFTGSDQAMQPDADLSAYAASKASVHSLCKTLARELGSSGIRVNAVAAGMTRTVLVETLMQHYAQQFGSDRHTAERREIQRRAIPAGRLAEPQEVAEAMVFLAKNAFMTGCILDMSGGNVRGL